MISDLRSSVRGEVQHPASYGIEPGERLSSVLKRCGGFTQQAYPYGAVLIRREVRELEMTSHLELVNRVKNEQSYLKSLPEADTDQKNAKLTAIAQVETTLQQLEATPPIGRVVIHLPSDVKSIDKMDKYQRRRSATRRRRARHPKEGELRPRERAGFQSDGCQLSSREERKVVPEPVGRIDAGCGQECGVCGPSRRLGSFRQEQLRILVGRSHERRA